MAQVVLVCVIIIGQTVERDNREYAWRWHSKSQIDRSQSIEPTVSANAQTTSLLIVQKYPGGFGVGGM